MIPSRLCQFGLKGCSFCGAPPSIPIVRRGDLKYYSEMGLRSCGPSRSACPHSSIFPLRSTLPCSCTNFILSSPALSRSCFAFLCFCSCQYNGWGGRGEVWLIPNATPWGCYHTLATPNSLSPVPCTRPGGRGRGNESNAKRSACLLQGGGGDGRGSPHPNLAHYILYLIIKQELGSLFAICRNANLVFLFVHIPSSHIPV